MFTKPIQNSMFFFRRARSLVPLCRGLAVFGRIFLVAYARSLLTNRIVIPDGCGGRRLAEERLAERARVARGTVRSCSCSCSCAALPPLRYLVASDVPTLPTFLRTTSKL